MIQSSSPFAISLKANIAKTGTSWSVEMKVEITAKFGSQDWEIENNEREVDKRQKLSFGKVEVRVSSRRFCQHLLVFTVHLLHQIPKWFRNLYTPSLRVGSRQ